MASEKEQTPSETDGTPQSEGQGDEGESATALLDRLGFKSEDALANSLKHAQRKITEQGEQLARLSEDHEGLLTMLQNKSSRETRTTTTESDLDDLGLGGDFDLGLGADVKKIRHELGQELTKLRCEIGNALGAIQISILEASDPEFKPEYLKGMEIEARRAPHLLQQGMPGVKTLYKRAKGNMQKAMDGAAKTSAKISLEALAELGIDVDKLPLRETATDGKVVSSSPKPARPGDRGSVGDPKQKALRGAYEAVPKGLSAVIEEHWKGRPE